jgi:hypothetical protein
MPMGFLLAFIALLFLKSSLQEGRCLPSYESLFGFSWHNFLCFILAWLFTFLFWLVLTLWGALFNIVDIDFFQDTFEEEWFLYPVLSLAFAYGVIIFRTKINAVGAMQRILRALISILLPLLLIISVMFVAVLPFTGVNLIWEKGYGSDTILGFVGLSLFFFNAVYQDAKEAPYRLFLNRFVQFSVMVLIVLIALSAYGMSLRVAQYGLTVERILAIVLICIMLSYVLLYTVIIVFKRTTWSLFFGQANTLMAILVSAIIVLMFTPVLDMSRISVDSQLSRLDQGKVPLEKFDFYFLARNGDVGERALRALQERDDVKASLAISKRIELALKTKGRAYLSGEMDQAVVKKMIKTYPLEATYDDSIWEFIALNSYNANECMRDGCALLQVDLNGDSNDEYILFSKRNSNTSLRFFMKNKEGEYQPQYTNLSLKMTYEELVEKLEAGSFSLVRPQWQDLKIGDEVIHTPSNNY